MKRTTQNLTIVNLCAVLCAGVPLTAQMATSKTYVLAAVEMAPGDRSNSTTYQLSTATANGIVPERSRSATYDLRGGYCALLDVKTTGRPILAGVLPRYATPRSAVAMTLHGSGLSLGTASSVTVGGVAATVLSRANDLITTKLPFQSGPPSKPGPGWQPVTVTNSFGSTTIVKGIGILPMLDVDPAPAPNVAFDIVFKGSQGDQVIWTLGIGLVPPIAISGFLHGLALNPAVLLFLPGFTIMPASGEFRFPIPATAYSGTIYAQALFLTRNAGYSPGSFTNVLTF